MKYEEYKDSGVAWIGEIPSHWEMVKLKYNFTIYAGATPKTEISDLWNGDIIWITPADYKTTDKYIMCGERTITKKGYDSCNTQIVPRDSLIFSKRAPIGTVAISGIELCTNQGCLSCVPKGVSTTFFYYATSVYSEIFDLLGSGATFKEISASDFSNVKLATPPLDEQQAIVNYLDEKCGKINNAIDVQKKKIDLLNELKQSIITEAVTKGLKPDAPMKDSSVDWIGKVPIHWNIMLGKFIVKVLPGYAFDSKKFTSDEGISLIRIRDINSTSTEMNYSGSFNEEYVVNTGDVLVGMDGDFNVAKWKGKRALLNQRVCKIVGTNIMLSSYMYYLLSRPLKLINDVCYATTVKHLSTSDIENSFFPVPTIQEQHAIVAYLNEKCNKIDGAIDVQKKKIDLLNELKQSIITEAVTGKIKVC